MNNKELARRWFEQVWNQKNGAIIAEMMDASASGVTEGGEVKGPVEFKAKVFDPIVVAFPDARVAIESTIAEGDDVAVRWTVTATHAGPLGPVAASGRRVKFSGTTCLKFKNGKIVGGSDSYNMHGLLAYLAEGNESATVRRS